MLMSIGLILLVGTAMGWLSQTMKLPRLLGMLVAGILLGPSVYNLIDPSVLDMSAELRTVALIVILTRAGLSLRVSDMKDMGRAGALMSFVPACFEIGGALLLAPPLLGVSLLDAAIIGAVLAAVSPAVIVPKMLSLMAGKYGAKNHVPQLILLGASLDDIFVIVLFSVFTGMAAGDGFTWITLANIPISIITGVFIGALVGYIIVLFFKRVKCRDTIKVLVIISVAFLLNALENGVSALPFASLIAILCVAIMYRDKSEKTALRLSIKFDKIWVVAEVILFALVGASVDMEHVQSAGVVSLCLLIGALACRGVGVLVSLWKTPLSRKERLFCVIAYTPKATVQAAIGGVPLAMGLSCGNDVLTVAVLSIIITAPLGAFAIDMTAKKLLNKEV